MFSFFKKLCKHKETKDNRLICNEAFDTVTVQADGTITCGCGDIYEGRSLGNVNNSSLSEIFNNDKYRQLRKGLLDCDFLPQCASCPVRVRERKGDESVDGNSIICLQVEPFFGCNLRCPDCALTKMKVEKCLVRPQTALTLETFCSLVDQTAKTLKHIRFHLLGEPFVNKDAGKMLAYAKNIIPDVFISIETNGLLLDESLRKTLIDSRVDYIKFSIDGASQETYGQYRVGGDFEKAYANMSDLIKERDERGADRPRVLWQYILFTWNDSDEEIKKAQQLAKEANVDELYWLTTHSSGTSTKYLPNKSYAIFQGERQSFNTTIEIAGKNGEPLTRPAPNLESYDPWK